MKHLEAPRNVVVVIGAGGMGLAVARRLAAGRRLLLADYSEASLDAALAALRGDGHAAEAHAVDVSDHSSVEKLAAAAGHAGRVDAVIHTAGVSPVTATARQIYHVDLLGTAHVIDAFLTVASPGMSLVCVASMAGHFASLPPDLERHLATAPADQLLRHPGIDLDSPDAGRSAAPRSASTEGSSARAALSGCCSAACSPSTCPGAGASTSTWPSQPPGSPEGRCC
jgi:NAD(P)-dependent dehydrogenase (short-subunit alcohol dehydrogenase family)